MIKKVKLIWANKLLNIHKGNYLKWLEQFDNLPMYSDKTPTMLAELWRRMDIGYLSNQDPTINMAVPLIIHHKNVMHLVQILDGCNNLMGEEDAEGVRSMAANEFSMKAKLETTLDYYLTDARGYNIDLPDTLAKIQKLLIEHNEILERNTNTFYRRTLSRLYEDVFSFTIVLINNIVEFK